MSRIREDIRSLPRPVKAIMVGYFVVCGAVGAVIGYLSGADR